MGASCKQIIFLKAADEPGEGNWLGAGSGADVGKG